MDKFVVSAIVEEKLVRVESDGTEQGTAFTGSSEHIERFRAAVQRGQEMGFEVASGVRTAQAGYDTPLGVAVALYCIAPYQTSLWEAPLEVFEFMTDADDVNDDISTGESPVCGKPFQP